MDDVLRVQTYNNLNLRETEDLLEIWQDNNTDEWEMEVFDIIREILLKRLGYIPPQSIQTQVKQALGKVDNYLQAREFEKALSECQLALQLAPDHAIVHNYRGLIFDEMGDLEKALADYQEAVRLDPELEDAWDNLISAEGDIEKEFQRSSAKEHLDQALEYAYSDEPEMALEECKLARQTLPGIALAYNYLGMVLEELEQVESAIDAYFEAIRLNPRFYSARENLANARVKFEAGQYHQASVNSWIGTQEEMDIFPDSNEFLGSEIPENNDPIPEWLYKDEKAYWLSGWPGHRNRNGRTGYDPLDVDFELAHIEGVIIRSLLTGKFRTYNQIYLFLMTGVGLLLCSPLLIGTTLPAQFSWAWFFVLIIFSPYWIVGAALLRNVYLSLRLKKVDEFDENGNAFF